MFYQYSRANQVFSLPSNIEQMDLTRMLMEHLSEHTQIKNIKVVRDSKGGVCAFVQCEVREKVFIVRIKTYIYALQNATSATILIQTLHSSAPKPFLGRILRYEPARAFRTLLVSYRYLYRCYVRMIMLSLSQHSHSTGASW